MSEPIFEDILYQTNDGIARITINRPKTLNAMRDTTFAELAAAIELAGQDRKIGVIVLSGTGDRAFSSGGVVKW